MNRKRFLLKTLFIVICVLVLGVVGNVAYKSKRVEGTDFHSCINAYFGHPDSVMERSKNAWKTYAHSLNEFEADVVQEGFDFVSGRLGWHTTWGVLVHTTDAGLIAYETFESGMVRPFGRTTVPWNVRAAVWACDAEWAGLWTADLPLRNAQKDRSTKSAPQKPTWEEITPPKLK